MLALTSSDRSHSCMSDVSDAMSSPLCRDVDRAAPPPPGPSLYPEPCTGSTEPLQDPHRFPVSGDRLAEVVQLVHGRAWLQALLLADPRDRAGDLGRRERRPPPEAPRVG